MAGGIGRAARLAGPFWAKPLSSVQWISVVFCVAVHVLLKITASDVVTGRLSHSSGSRVGNLRALRVRAWSFLQGAVHLSLADITRCIARPCLVFCCQARAKARNAAVALERLVEERFADPDALGRPALQ